MASKKVSKQVIRPQKTKSFSIRILLISLVLGVMLLLGAFIFFDYREANQLEAEGDVYYELGKYPEAVEKYLFASKKQSPFIENAEIETKISSARSKYALEEQNKRNDEKKEEVKSPKVESNTATKNKVNTIIKPQPSPTKSGQAIVVEHIKDRMNQLKSEIEARQKIMEEEGKFSPPYCGNKYPNDLSAWAACDAEHSGKYNDAWNGYTPLKEEYNKLYHQLLDIAGQK